MDAAERYQRQLLEQCGAIHADTPISEATAAAYLATPRHLFVGRYREWGSRQWHDVTPDTLAGHLAALYGNRPLILAGDDDDDLASTISQPSFVLRQLDLLRLEPGHRVLELGAGSGWNAALMGHLVGPHGHVWTLEILPGLAATAAGALERLGRRNVTVVAADGGDGHAAAAPYDRAIFTAGAYDLPRAFHDQLVEGGLLLAVIKNAGGGDNLFLLRKTADHLASLDAMPCGFVQLRGRCRIESLEPIPVESLPGWAELPEVSRSPFWWGGKGKEGAVWRTLGIRSFLSITEPAFRAFKAPRTERRPREEHFFGLWMPADGSLVLARDDALIAHGNDLARQRLLFRIRQWVDLGMPAGASFTLRVYPRETRLTPGDGEWLVIREESQFLWSLPGGSGGP
jgi:protein-L-isoaspartate(D-aspartate) O-methyltransferase